MTRRRMGLIAAALAWQLGGAQRGAAVCIGDCDGSGAVRIDELVAAVNLALGGSGTACAPGDGNGDGDIGINELVTAVRAALGGCRDQPATAQSVAQNYAAMLFENYSDSVADARALQTAIDALAAAPSAATLQAAKSAWLAGRPRYLQTEMARFYDGPIDNPDDGPEGLINSWPLDESYIDYVQGQPQAGVVNAVTLYSTIDQTLISELNEAQGETTISTGWHAIEFLLWGQDVDPNGPGQRPFTDYATDGSGTAANQGRRGDYLRAAAALMVQDLEQVRDAWDPNRAGDYRAEFLSVVGKEALRRILTGMGSLSGGELTGERLSTAFDTKDQEDEHSCFSDNTYIDHRNDELGIQNAFFGRYGTVHGPGIYDLVRTVNPTLADATRDAMNAARAAIYAIPVPFDQAILGPDTAPGRVAIAAAIAALNAQTERIAECAAALGVSISTTGP